MKVIKNINNDDVMLVNIMYHRGTADTEWKDSIDIIYKDLNTNEKYLYTIDEPKMEIYFTKPELRHYNYNKLFIDMKEADVHTVKYRNLEREIAKEAGSNYEQFIKQCIETGNRAGIKNVHKCPFVFGSDFDIENWYKVQWVLNHNNSKNKPVTKQFLDIEVDGIDVAGIPKPGEYPINAVTLVDQHSMTCLTYALRNEKNPQIQELEDDMDGFINELHELFDESYGRLDYKVLFYSDELKMIKDLYGTINILKRDFLVIWNMGFDIPFIIERIKNLGGVPEEIMCHRDFKVKECYFKKDTVNFMVENKSDFFKCSSYTTTLDQMVLYAANRKGQGTIRSNRLNDIALIELKDEKLDYSEDATIKTLPYVNYRKFLIYNIKDTLLQLGIEQKTNDLDAIYLRALDNATAYHKVFKQSIFLKNRSYIEFYKQGFIIGNNPNTVYGKVRSDDFDDDDEGYDGALVADPELNSYEGMTVLGRKSKYVYKLVIDMDFSAMYPNIIISINVAANTMIAKLIINDTVEDFMNKMDIDADKYDSGKDFIDNYLTGNILNLCKKWFNLPGIMELIEDYSKGKNKKVRVTIPEKYTKQFFPMGVTVELK